MLPSLDDPEARQLAPGEAADAEESLRSIREELRLGESAQAVKPARRPFAWPSWRSFRVPSPLLRPRVLLPIAVATALALFLLPRSGKRPALEISDLRIRPASSLRGPSPSGSPERPAQPFRTGDACELVFTTTQRGYPVVFLVDPVGQVELLHPEDPRTGAEAVPAATAIRLPAEGSDTLWILEGATGPETFFLAISRRPLVGLPDLADAAKALGRIDRDRDSVVSALREMLVARVGCVDAIEITHLPAERSP
jgi:hypothetical protein